LAHDTSAANATSAAKYGRFTVPIPSSMRELSLRPFAMLYFLSFTRMSFA